MNTAAVEHAEKILPPDMFAFEFDAELRRAVRSRSNLTLVVVATNANGDGEADVMPLKRVAKAICPGIRETDVLGYSDGALALVLVDANLAHSTTVIRRLVTRIEAAKLSDTFKVAIGAASYPDDAIDATSLRREALSRTLVSLGNG